MAYTSSVSVTQPRTGVFVLTITETDCAASSEVEISILDPAGDGSMPALPTVGRVISRLCALTAGSGTTVDPILGDASDPAANAGWLYEHGTAANPVHDRPLAPIYYHHGVTSFYHRSVPDAGTDNSVSTTYYIIEAWR